MPEHLLFCTIIPTKIKKIAQLPEIISTLNLPTFPITHRYHHPLYLSRVFPPKKKHNSPNLSSLWLLGFQYARSTMHTQVLAQEGHLQITKQSSKMISIFFSK